MKGNGDMKRFVQKIFCILLSLTMIISIYPSLIFADTPEGDVVFEIDFTQYAGKTWSEVKSLLNAQYGVKSMVSGDGGNVLRTPTANGIEVTATAKAVTSSSSIGFGKFDFSFLNLSTGRYVVDFEIINGVNDREYRYELTTQANPGDYGGTSMTRLTLNSGNYIKAGYNAGSSLTAYDVLTLSGGSKTTMAKNTYYGIRQVVNLDERSIDETYFKSGDGEYIQQTVKTVASGAKLGYMYPGMRTSETQPHLGGMSLSGTGTGNPG